VSLRGAGGAAVHAARTVWFARRPDELAERERAALLGSLPEHPDDRRLQTTPCLHVVRRAAGGGGLRVSTACTTCAWWGGTARDEGVFLEIRPGSNQSVRYGSWRTRGRHRREPADDARGPLELEARDKEGRFVRECKSSTALIPSWKHAPDSNPGGLGGAALIPPRAELGTVRAATVTAIALWLRKAYGGA